MNKKLTFVLIWLLIISIGPITILTHTNLSVVIKNQATIFNLLQRFVGLLVFTLIFIQIILGSFMSKWIEKFGGWVLSFHIAEGIATYLLAFTHPLLFTLFNYKIKGAFDPFYVFTDLCVICKSNLEIFYTLGRLSFWLLTITVAAAWFRTNPLLRLHWRKFHILNYVVFFLIWIHSYKLGSDVQSFPFFIFHRVSLAIVSGIVGIKVWNLYRTSKGKAN